MSKNQYEESQHVIVSLRDKRQETGTLVRGGLWETNLVLYAFGTHTHTQTFACSPIVLLNKYEQIYRESKLMHKIIALDQHCLGDVKSTSKVDLKKACGFK